MRHLAFSLIIAIGCRSSERDAAAPPVLPGSPAAGSLARDLDSLSRKFAEENRVPGMAVGVVQRGQVIYRAGFGVTAIPGGQAITSQTIFHLASVTKPFVATAVMQLVEQGKVSLDSTVSRYLPYFQMKDPRASDMTIRQVLAHVAGLPDVTDYHWASPEYDDAALERYIRGLADSSLIAAPGAGWQYSNIGFELLADLVAKVSGTPFEVYVQQHILTPLRMTKSTLLMTDVDSTLLARGHSDSAGAYQLNPVYPYNRRHAGSSTLHSNVDDMLRWATANLNRGTLEDATILQPFSYDQLWKPERDITTELLGRAKAAGVEVPYTQMHIGLSWFLPTRNGKRLVFHSGGDRGFATDLMLSPSDSVGIVVLGNGDRAQMWNLSIQLLDVVTGRPPSS